MPSHVEITEEVRERFEAGGLNTKETQATKLRVYKQFIKYCLNTTGDTLNSDDVEEIQEAGQRWFEKMSDDDISKAFGDFFLSMMVLSTDKNPDGTYSKKNKRPKKKTAETNRSHIKMTVMQRHHFDLGDPVRFPNDTKQWKGFMELLKQEGKKEAF